MAAFANAECPNACSGHGTCGRDDICTCFQNWQNGDHQGGDCSDRTCPYDIAWADVPSGNNAAHFYSECSGRGLCDRKTGECDCFDGFTGASCKRSTCPNDCSGHGTCEFMSDVFPDVQGQPTHLTHDLLGKVWDADKSRVCVCDGKWTDVDCSRKMCPKGNDPLDDCSEGYNDANMQIQYLCQYGGSVPSVAGEFAIKYNDYYGGSYTTSAIASDATAEEVMDALLSLPDRAIESVNVEAKVEADCDPNGYATFGTFIGAWAVTFQGHQVSGAQHTLEIIDQACSAGCQPRIVGLKNDVSDVSIAVSIHQEAQSNMYECSRRGKCDYDAGICECFDGFTDEDCSVQSSLA